MNLFIQMEAVQKQWHVEIQIGGIYARNKMVNVQVDSFDDAMVEVRKALKVIAPRDFIALYKLEGDEPAVVDPGQINAGMPDPGNPDPKVDNLAKARAAKAAKRAEAAGTIYPVRELPK